MPIGDILTEDATKQLLDLCRTGKLYEIERWIDAGRSLRTPSKPKKTPLEVAVEQGFHSLVDLLARKGTDVAVKNKALSLAVEKKRLDLVQVLIGYGAEIKAVSLVDVFLTWEPSLIRYFLDNGADVITDAPFAVAFAEKIRTALRPFVDYKQTHPDLADQLQRQADQALRYFASKGDLKWVSLMLWAGANPHTRGPSLFEGHEDDPDWHTTAIDEACHHGYLEILKTFKPTSQTDDLGELLSSALFSRGEDILDYLLKIGAKPNNKANGGSAALNRCLSHFRFENIGILHQKTPIPKHAVRRTFETMRTLIANGACWRPDDQQHMNWVRKSLYECEPAVTVEVVKILAQNQAATQEVLEELLAAPRMRQHLSALGINVLPNSRGKSRTQRVSPQ